MLNFFVNINKILSRRPGLFLFLLLLFLAACVYLASGVKIEENLNAIIPEDQRITRISEVFDKSQLADQIIFMISEKDSSSNNPDHLIKSGEHLLSRLEERMELVGKIRFKVEENTMLETYDFIYEHLPLFLDSSDYSDIEKMLDRDNLDRTISAAFRTLISPAGMATGKFIIKDPLSITPMGLKKLSNFQLDDNFTVHNSAIFTRDKKNLMIFMDPAYPGSNTQENLKLISHIDQSIDSISRADHVYIEYYGGTAVAVANSVRVKKDIVLTLSIAFLLFMVIFLVFFRKIWVILLMFLPVLIGSLVSIAILSLIYDKISAIGLGIGVIFMGITIDYSLHFFTHIRAGSSVRDTIRRVTMPITMSAVTTASAFLCLSIVKAEALNQIGVFAAFAVVFSALSVLIISPLLIRNNLKNQSSGRARISDRIEKMVGYSFEKNRILIGLVLLFSILFAFTFQHIRFNGDISSLNYLSDDLAKSESKLKSISSVANSSVYLVTQATSLEEALVKIEAKKDILDSCRKAGLFSEISEVSDLIRSSDAQQEKIDQWNQFWEAAGIESTKINIRESGLAYHFKADAFQSFYKLLDKEFVPVSLDEFKQLRELFLNNFISEEEGEWSVVSILMVDPQKKEALFERLKGFDDMVIFDSQFFINQFFEVLKEDFSKLVIISMIVVFLILLIFFGRIEIALVTFIPIMLSWLWTLGLMGLFKIEINIFNIIISTFIFGLGIDYAIFITNGLIANYKEGNQSLAPYKLSILLSALTTIGAIGVLIFAQHPALKSIAMVSIFGISTVVFITYTLLPLLFNFLIKSKGKPRLEPLTFSGALASLLFFILFLGSGILATILLPLALLWPARKSKKEKLMTHLIYLVTRFIVWVSFTVKKKYINRDLADFSSPSVIISNHQSQLDLVFLLQLNPKIIVLVNKWVWNNFFYGFIIRFAGYYPVYKGLDYNFEGLKQKVNEGYSILAFPEASRSADGSIKRFHQGAFGIADMLGLEVQPVMIHGAYDSLPKTEHFLKKGRLTVKFFPRIKPEFEEHEVGRSYRKQAKSLTAFYRKAYKNLHAELGNTDYYRNNLMGRFLYKGPVTEWYLRIKLKLEKNYSFYQKLIPGDAVVADLGCGFGFLSIMLGLCSKERHIIGIDYDSRKIASAQQAARGLDHISFRHEDLCSCNLPEADVYILNDVLHYLPEDLQLNLLDKCMDLLPSNGMLFIRDADADLKRRTSFTKFTELNSTRIFGFNKTSSPLNFVPASTIEKQAEQKGLQWERVDQAKLTSNITYIIRR